MDTRFEKKDDDERINPFANLVKSTVLQEARVFHKAPISPSRCIPLLTQILYLMHQGQRLTTTEATDIFFATTKLFQSNHTGLRRMVYLVVKELADVAEDTIIITAVVMKDLNSSTPQFKANAVRVLCGITDATMLAQIERYIQQAIVDKSTYVASAALVSALHLYDTSKDVVRRWLPQVEEALKGRALMVQYHALGIVYKIKQHDRLAVRRLVETLTRSTTLRCPYATCYLIRLVGQVIAEDTSGSINPLLYEYLELCLHHSHEMVIYEAARTICNIPGVSARELTPAVTVLQLFLGAPKSSHKYAAVRTLNAVAFTHPFSVTQCIIDLEHLVKDPNRSIATLAITTLLKTGSEASVDRLMKQMGEFMGDIPDEFKVVVIEAIRALCLKYPAKHRLLMKFLAETLREEGGYEYKRVIVDTIMLLISSIPEARPSGLVHLCEFIEDCEYAALSVRVLHVLGEEGPSTPNPSKYIRFIYNRVILETVDVRAAAVSALAKFGFKCPDIRDSVCVLLNRCLFDDNDEVRDRCAMYLAMLQGDVATAEDVALVTAPAPDLDALESALLAYQSAPSRDPFDVAAIPIAVTPDPAAAASSTDPAAGAPEARQTPGAAYIQQLTAVPELASLGKPYAVSNPVSLTEEETEYQVSVVKHVFATHVVFQLIVNNTVDNQKLLNVVPELEFDDGDAELDLQLVVPAPEAAYGTPSNVWVAAALPHGSFPTAVYACILKFLVVSVNADGVAEDDGYEDEYEVEVIELTAADYMQSSFVPNFAAAWDKFPEDQTTTQVFQLASMSSIRDAVSAIVSVLGMQVAERTNSVKENASSHTLLLAGVFAGKAPVLARVRFKLDANSGAVAMELSVRSAVEAVRLHVLGLIG